MAEHRSALRRPRGRDPLGLRRALGDRLLPTLVGAMALLAALALGLDAAAEGFAERWQGAAAAFTVELPDGDTDMAAAVAKLQALPGVEEVRPVDPAHLSRLLKPWLGDDPGIALPGMLELAPSSGADLAPLAQAIQQAVPGVLVEQHGPWVARVSRLGRSLQAVALAVLLLVGGVAASLIAMTTHSGITSRRQAIAVLHDLGARDADIAGRFAARLGWLALLGGIGGVLVAAPVLAFVAGMVAPLVDGGVAVAGGYLTWFRFAGLPWPGLLVLPLAAGLIGWLAAQITVRRWLRRLS